MGRAARPWLDVQRESDGVCIVRAFTPRRWCSAGAHALCRLLPAWCARAPRPLQPAVVVTAVRGVGLSIDRGAGHRATLTIPAERLAALFVHEAFLHCDVVATLAAEVHGAGELVLPLEAVGFRVPIAQVVDAWRELAGALALGVDVDGAARTPAPPRQEQQRAAD